MSNWNDKLRAVPWIKELDLKKSIPCDGVVWKRVSQRRGYGSAHSKCKNKAHWRFTALRARKIDWMGSKTGNYCFSHVWTQIYDSGREDQRFIEWNNEQKVF